MQLCGESEAWREPQGGRRRRRRRREEQDQERLRKALRDARSELQRSEFWVSSLKTILTSLRKYSARPQEASALNAALENLRLSPSADPATASSPQPEEEPTTSSSSAQGFQCVSYGIGNFSSCARSRYQLAFLLLLLEELEIPTKLCYVFDPVFSTLETDILNSLGVTVLSENEEGKRHIQDPTLFYMIHCGKALYNNLLWSNWTPERLANLVIIGNSFRGIEERLLTKVLQRDYGYVAKVLRATEEAALPSSQQYLDIFNDTSVHCFPLHKLMALPLETWAAPEEPVYPEDEQLEIIRKE